MPFSDAFTEIYELGIKQACLNSDTYCERVDEQYFDGSIIERVYNQISKSDLIIADVTGRNPNVFYEVGYAHALGKRTILITQFDDDIPFDLKHYSHIVYGKNIINLKKELEPKIKWAITHQGKLMYDVFSILQFKLANFEIKDNSKIIFPLVSSATQEALAASVPIPLFHRMKIDIQNTKDIIFDGATIQIGLVLPTPLLEAEKKLNIIEISETHSIIIFDNLKRFLPYSWQSVFIDINKYIIQKYVDTLIPIRIELFTEYEKKDRNFSILFSKINEITNAIS